jgi:hypothetical protein
MSPLVRSHLLLLPMLLLLPHCLIAIALLAASRCCCCCCTAALLLLLLLSLFSLAHRCCRSFDVLLHILRTMTMKSFLLTISVVWFIFFLLSFTDRRIGTLLCADHRSLGPKGN